MKYICDEEKQTIALAQKMAKNPPKVLALKGDLAMGKTFFTKAYAKALGIKEEVLSPTFSIVREYRDPLVFFHWDLYRVEDEDELFQLGFEEYLQQAHTMVIEWPELVLESLEEPVVVHFYYEDGHRIIEVKNDTSH